MIGLVSCSVTKLLRAAPARELYTSALFRKSLAHAERHCERVYILSALHGLVELDRRLEPYNRRLGSKKEREAWARRVASHLIGRHGRAVDYLLLAGVDYAGPLATALSTHDGFREDGWHGVPRERIHRPLAGMQVGQRLRWLNDQIVRSAA